MNCTSCAGIGRQQDFPNCTCGSGYYDDGLNADCVKCDYKCAECAGLPANCTECAVGYQRKMNEPLCGCKQGYTENDTEVIDCVTIVCPPGEVFNQIIYVEGVYCVPPADSKLGYCQLGFSDIEG